ncbi:hypothetical protein Spa11_09930 [Botrimarina mediterranea]|uniref:PEP-CTERM sorting domain-containing protein n=1 Tax=Botrimarina mediterranea TaxID=2528022 RepID=A0A518K4U1_9BACT|nr:hypothetical protein Spa11_09930 [Botrimarina mediterranea]
MITKLSLLSVATVALVAVEARASLVTNGTFDTDLTGWQVNATGTDVVPVAGTARIGQPGTPGTAILSQFFDIPAGTTAVKISFDYEWQVNPPTLPDTFSVSFDYLGGSVQTLLTEFSSAATFNSTIAYNITLLLPGLQSGPGNGFISFQLDETNPSVGTRIELDNVSISAVPEAGALAVWSVLGSVGMLGMRRPAREDGEE